MQADLNLPERLFAAWAQRLGYAVAVALVAVLGGHLAAVLGFIFIINGAALTGPRLLHLLSLMIMLVPCAALVHLVSSGLGGTALALPSCRRINAAFHGLRLKDEVSAEALLTLLRDLEQLPVLYTVIAAVLSGLVVLLVSLDALVRAEPVGWYVLGGGLAILLYVTYAVSVTELALYPAVGQVRRRLAERGTLPTPWLPWRLRWRMMRLLVPNVVAVVVLTALFGQRPDLAQQWGVSLAWGGGVLALTFVQNALILNSIRQAHLEVRQMVQTLVGEGRADFISSSLDQDFFEIAQDIYQVAQQIVVAQRTTQELNQTLEERIAARVAEIERQQQILRAILDNIAEGLVVTDREGRLVITNDIFRAIFPTTARDAGVTLEDIFPKSGLHQLIQQALASPERAHELQLIAPDRHVYQILARALPVHTGLGCVMVWHDITHDVELAHMKTNFISSVSHELRTPLTSILGFAKLTRRTFEQIIVPHLPMLESLRRAAERVTRNLDILIQESERLTSLINDVLDLAALDSGKLEWNDTMCEPQLLIEESVSQFRPQADKKGLTFLVEQLSPLPPIKADPLRIRQVLDNLISNAIKFTNSGWVKVSARALQAGEAVNGWTAPQEGGILITVADTGPGVPVEYQPYIFERFWQGGDYIHDKPKGTGLGLALSHDIVKHYRGTIRVRNAEIGQGAIFEVALPAGEQLPMPVNGAAMADTSFAPRLPAEERTVLVVDDDPAILEWLHEELGQRGYQVLGARNASEGMTLARMHQPDVILLDVMMPGISGLEVLRLLKADAKTQAIPVVMLTIADEREAALALGARAYLKKPIEVQEIVSVLQSVLGAPVA